MVKFVLMRVQILIFPGGNGRYRCKFMDVTLPCAQILRRGSGGLGRNGGCATIRVQGQSRGPPPPALRRLRTTVPKLNITSLPARHAKSLKKSLPLPGYPGKGRDLLSQSVLRGPSPSEHLRVLRDPSPSEHRETPLHLNIKCVEGPFSI